MKMSIKKSLRGLLIVPALALAVGVVVPVVQPDVAQAQTSWEEGIEGGLGATGQEDKNIAVDSLITRIVNVLLYIIGAASVIMIIVGGFKYVTSGGDSNGVTSAKNTILYAVIGLVVALLAYAIVNFVLKDVLNNVAS